MPGDFDFDDDMDDRRRPGTARYRADEEDVPIRPRRPAAKPIPPLVIAAVAGAGVMFLVAVVVAVLVIRKATREEAPVADSKTAAATTVPAITGPRPATTVPPKKDPDPAAAMPSREVVDRVKAATVRVRVLFNNKQAGSGSGFVEESSRKVLTNAHVLGLLQKKGEPKLGGPRAIELVVNSGEPGKEYALGGELIAADLENDLALVRPYLLDPGERHIVPKGLVVPKTPNVALLQRLFVFGYPFGEQLGAEITVSETSVSSLRRDTGTGRLSHIQVKGGMNPGNSGGPVVDVKGNVVGVAVAGIKGTDINFAIAGEVVQEFLAKHK